MDGFGFRCGRLFIVAMVARFEGSRAGRGWSEVGQHYHVLVACKFALLFTKPCHVLKEHRILCIKKKKLIGICGVSTQKKHDMAGHHMKMNLVRMS